MISFPLSRTTLVFDAVTGLALSTTLFGLAWWFVTEGSAPLIIPLIIVVLGLLGFATLLSPVMTLVKGTPALVANDLGIAVERDFGRMTALKWENVGRISIERIIEGVESESSDPIYSYSNYLLVYHKRNANDAFPTAFLKLSERRTADDLKRIVDALKNHPEATKLLDEKAREYVYVSDFKRITLASKVYIFIAISVVAAFVLFHDFVSALMRQLFNIPL